MYLLPRGSESRAIWPVGKMNLETTPYEQKLQICTNWEFWGLNNKPSNSCHWFLCFGTRPRHQTRASYLGPPRLMNGSYALARSRGYTTGTIFIQGPSIVLPVWRCIMFNGSYLRACMKLWILQKIRFPFMSLGGPRHGARVWCLGRVPKHRN